MNLSTNKQVQIGDCETCENTETELFLMHGNTLMCLVCRDKDLAIMQTATKKSESTNQVIENSHKVDDSIQSANSILNAETVAITELKAAIQHDESIPESEKEYAFSEECKRRVQVFKRIVFDSKKVANDAEMACRIWQVNGQQSVAKLAEEKRAKYTEFDITYQHVTPKSIKSPTPSVVVKRSEVISLATKYGIPHQAITKTAKERKISVEAAALLIARLLKKI